MPYTGTDPDLIDLQSQITTNLNTQAASLKGLQTQIKQVTLALESELDALKKAFDTLKAYVTSRIQP